MIEIENKFNCCGCSACYNICPKKAIFMEEDEQGFLYPKVNHKLCINCGLCEKVCPVINSKPEDSRFRIAYAARSNDTSTRMKSSSGGIFTEIAKEIINSGGAVFGAEFNSEFEVVHKKELKEELLKKFQSKLGKLDF